MKAWHAIKELGKAKLEDEDIGEFIFQWQTTGAKLAGALNGIAQDRHTPDAAFTVACLKRALNHLHQSQAGLEQVAKREVLPAKLVAESRAELFALREGILKLMNEFRGPGRN